MSTTAQIEANRENSRSSTGPATPEGKRASSQNAIKHGLTSVHLIQPGENKADYESLETSLTHDWRPADTTEFSLVKEIAQSYWKLQRIRRVESVLLEASITIEHREFCERRGKELPLNATSVDTFMLRGMEAKDDSFKNLSRYETKYERAWYRAINTLTKLQAERRKQERAVTAGSGSSPNGFVQQNDPEPVTLENASPEIQKLILETSAQLIQKFIEENGFVS